MTEPETLEAPKVKPTLKQLYGQRFAKARQAANASLKTVAAAAGVSFVAISQFEQGKQSLSLDSFALACAVLQVRTDWVLYGRGELFDGEPPQLCRKGGRPADRGKAKAS